MLTEEAAIAIQEALRKQVISSDQFSYPIKYIAGTDVEYDKETNLIAGSIVVLDYQTHEVTEVATHCMEVGFPYIPGLFSFREMPPLLEAFKKLKTLPDIFICDAQGMAHQRRFGLACHFGVTINYPVIGCGKTKLFGVHEVPGEERGSVAPLKAPDSGEIIGNVLRTKSGINPVYVSVGHKISLASATEIVLKMCTQYRLPETTRLADHYGRLALLAEKNNF
jgi:deoxyribonuclease V